MNCLQNSQWTEALTLDVGLKVHDAATELLWVLWSPPEPVKEKVRTFMRENIKEITRSLDAFSIPASRRSTGLSIDAERIKGTNPTWDTRGGFFEPSFGWGAAIHGYALWKTCFAHVFIALAMRAKKHFGFGFLGLERAFLFSNSASHAVERFKRLWTWRYIFVESVGPGETIEVHLSERLPKQ